MNAAVKDLGATIVYYDDIFIFPYENKIFDVVNKADIFIVDTTELTDEIMYVMGAVHTQKKPLLHIFKEGTDVPALLSQDYAILYSEKNLFTDFLDEIKDWLKRAILFPESFLRFGMDTQMSDNKSAITNQKNNNYDKQTSTTTTDDKKTIFISYSHRDSVFMDRLLIHLKPLERIGKIVPWSDKKINSGDNWKDEIKKALNLAKAAILLISPDFLASDFIHNDELPPLLNAAEKEGVKIIPVILKHCQFNQTKSLAQFQSINSPEEPLTSIDNPDVDKFFNKIASMFYQY